MKFLVLKFNQFYYGVVKSIFQFLNLFLRKEDLIERYKGLQKEFFDLFYLGSKFIKKKIFEVFEEYKNLYFEKWEEIL